MKSKLEVLDSGIKYRQHNRERKLQSINADYQAG